MTLIEETLKTSFAGANTYRRKTLFLPLYRKIDCGHIFQSKLNLSFKKEFLLKT